MKEREGNDLSLGGETPPAVCSMYVPYVCPLAPKEFNFLTIAKIHVFEHEGAFSI